MFCLFITHSSYLNAQLSTCQPTTCDHSEKALSPGYSSKVEITDMADSSVNLVRFWIFVAKWCFQLMFKSLSPHLSLLQYIERKPFNHVMMQLPRQIQSNCANTRPHSFLLTQTKLWVMEKHIQISHSNNNKSSKPVVELHLQRQQTEVIWCCHSLLPASKHLSENGHINPLFSARLAYCIDTHHMKIHKVFWCVHRTCIKKDPYLFDAVF